MKRTAIVIIVLVALAAGYVAGQHPEKFKFPWAGANWNDEITKTRLEFRCEAHNWKGEPQVLHEVSGKVIWSVLGIQATPQDTHMAIEVWAKPHFRASQVRDHHYELVARLAIAKFQRDAPIGTSGWPYECTVHIAGANTKTVRRNWPKGSR